MGLTTAGVKIHDDWWPQNSFKDVSWICNKNLNISCKICVNMSGVCADPLKICIFHQKYV